MEDITIFRGKYSFLSNFYEAPITYNGKLYKSTEYAYQCAKMTNEDDLELVRTEFTPGRAKRLANKLKNKDNWNDMKIDVMRELLYLKFLTHKNLLQKLLNTGNRNIIENNNHKDSFWGVYKGTGRNELGKLLMEIREKLK